MLSEESVVEFVLGLEGVSERETEVSGSESSAALSDKASNKDGSNGEKKMRIFDRGGKICLAVEANTNPLRIELRCDVRLSKTLQERYESVMESRALGRNGIEIICSGQLQDDEIFDLIRHSYEISAASE